MNKPKQYTNGFVEFYKLKFKVTPDVLIPRPETELLVDEVLSFTRFNLNQGSTLTNLTILDLGTGAGNIAISLACHLEGINVNIIATDVSPKALKIAKQNARLHEVLDKITFIESNLLSGLNSELITPKSELIIVTNLPYIPSARIPYLDSSVKNFEPLVALDGGEDGFDLYRKLFQQIVEKNLPTRLIIGEIDYTQAEVAIDEVYKYFPQASIEVKKDLRHLQRVLTIKN